MALSGFEIAIGGLFSIPVVGGLVFFGYKAWGEKNLDASKLKPKKPAAPAAEKKAPVKAKPAAEKKAAAPEVEKKEPAKIEAAEKEAAASAAEQETTQKAEAAVEKKENDLA